MLRIASHHKQNRSTPTMNLEFTELYIRRNFDPGKEKSEVK